MISTGHPALAIADWYVSREPVRIQALRHALYGSNAGTTGAGSVSRDTTAVTHGAGTLAESRGVIFRSSGGHQVRRSGGVTDLALNHQGAERSSVTTGYPLTWCPLPVYSPSVGSLLGTHLVHLRRLGMRRRARA
jgi:hypothetical protein